MRTALLLLLLVACDTQGTPVCFEDHFDTLASRWTVMNPGSDVVTTNGRLQIAIPPATDTMEGIKGIEPFDLRDGFVVAEVARYAEPSVNAQSEFVVRIDDMNQIYIGFMWVGGPSFVYRMKSGGVIDDALPEPFDAAVRFWRVSSTGGEVRFDGSTDGTTWITRRTATAGFALDALTLQFESDTSMGGVAIPGSFEIERVIVASPSCERTDAPAPHP
jgi:hypothetical protein